MRRVKLGGVGKVFLKTRHFGAFMSQLLLALVGLVVNVPPL